MNRRDFINKTALATAAGFTASMTLDARADALEYAMMTELDKEVHKPWMCDVTRSGAKNMPLPDARRKLALMGDDPRLPKMPEKPTLIDFFKLRMGSNMGTNHLLQSARLAQENGLSEKIVLACLLHDISVVSLIRTDHGYWASQMLEPYVDKEVSWAIRYHQSLRFIPDQSVDYEYPQSYIRAFGEDYELPEYIKKEAKYAQNHKWYMSARHITLNDLYAFDPNKQINIEEYTDIIGRHFKQPKEGLGFDNSPVAHMWRTIIWPNNYL